MYETVDHMGENLQELGEVHVNPAYGKHAAKNTPENTYEMVDETLSRQEAKEQSTEPLDPRDRNYQGTPKSMKLPLAICVVAILALLALATAVVAVALILVVSNQQIQSLQSESQQQARALHLLRVQLNQTSSQANSQAQTNAQLLNTSIQDQNLITQIWNILQSSSLFPIASCRELALEKPSGDYWITGNSSLVEVYCEKNRQSCSCNSNGWWMRVAKLDMTDPNQNCPVEFTTVTRATPPLRTCGRLRNGRTGCVSTTYQTHGVAYTQACGRIKAYQYGRTNAFIAYHLDNGTTDSLYVDGISLTHGQLPRQHIWTFAGAQDETGSSYLHCPCTRPDITFTGSVPPFVGQDYFCDTASRDAVQVQFYPDDPLWDGQGCGGTSTYCEFNNPPWFCKQLPQLTTEDIELRICYSSGNYIEDTPLEIVEICIR